MKVFLSSTIYELIDLRAELYSYLTSAGFHIIISEIGASGFEIAGNLSSIECCLSNVRSCDALILIADRQYGPTLENHDYPKLSATHLEYKEAIQANIPVYVYLRDRTDAELSIYKSSRKKGIDWEGGEWVSKKDVGLLELLAEHSQLEQKNKQNWLTVFRTSVDLKEAIANHLRLPRYNHDLARMIASGDVPILEVVHHCEIINNSVKFKATVTNKGNTGVFIKRMEWANDNPSKEAYKHIDDIDDLLPPHCSRSIAFIHTPGSIPACASTLTLIYYTYDGLTIEELWAGKYQVSNNSILSGMYFKSRKFRLAQAVTMKLEH